jgi:hypothetical protein
VVARWSRLLVVGALVVVALGLAGCQVVSDPTENEAVLHLQNDLDVRVQLSPCEDSSCRSLAGSVRSQVAPGGSLPVNVSSEGVATYYRVDERGEPARCLRLMVKGTPRESTVPLSSAAACSSTSQSGTGLVGDVAAWGLVFGVGLAGLAISGVATRHAYVRLRGVPRAARWAVPVAVIVGLAMFVGGWLIVALYRLARRSSWLLRMTVRPSLS